MGRGRHYPKRQGIYTNIVVTRHSKIVLIERQKCSALMAAPTGPLASAGQSLRDAHGCRPTGGETMSILRNMMAGLAVAAATLSLGQATQAQTTVEQIRERGALRVAGI